MYANNDVTRRRPLWTTVKIDLKNCTATTAVKSTMLVLSFLSLLSMAYGRIPNSVIPTDCFPVRRQGLGVGCCSGTGQSPNYGNPCSGDLNFPLCASPTILDITSPDGGIYGGSEQVNLPADDPNVIKNCTGCPTQRYLYKFYCCNCPAGTTFIQGRPGCDEEIYPGWCAKCSDPSDVLIVGSDLTSSVCEAPTQTTTPPTSTTTPAPTTISTAPPTSSTAPPTSSTAPPTSSTAATPTSSTAPPTSSTAPPTNSTAPPTSSTGPPTNSFTGPPTTSSTAPTTSSTAPTTSSTAPPTNSSTVAPVTTTAVPTSSSTAPPTTNSSAVPPVSTTQAPPTSSTTPPARGISLSSTTPPGTSTGPPILPAGVSPPLTTSPVSNIPVATAPPLTTSANGVPPRVLYNADVPTCVGASCCPSGYYLTTPSAGCVICATTCTRCDAGQALQGNTCIRCAAGQYAGLFATSCASCPSGTTTANGAPGSSAADCKPLTCSAVTQPPTQVGTDFSFVCNACDIGSGSAISSGFRTLSDIPGITATLTVGGLSSTGGYTVNNYTGTVSYDANRHTCGQIAWLLQQIVPTSLNCAASGPSCTPSSDSDATQHFAYILARTTVYDLGVFCYPTSQQAETQAGLVRSTALSGGFDVPLLRYYTLPGLYCFAASAVKYQDVLSGGNCLSCSDQKYVWNPYANFYSCQASKCCGTAVPNNPENSVSNCPQAIQNVTSLSPDGIQRVSVFSGALSPSLAPIRDYCNANYQLCNGPCSLGFSCSGPTPPPPTKSPNVTTAAPGESSPEKESPEPEEEEPEPLTEEEAEAEPAPEHSPETIPYPEGTQCLLTGIPCGKTKFPNIAEQNPCNPLARNGTTGVCCDFDRGSPLICSDYLCVPAFDPSDSDKNCSCGGQVVSVSQSRRKLQSDSCPVPPDPCPGLATLDGAEYQGNQVVISSEFGPYLEALLECALNNGFEALNVRNTGRCKNEAKKGSCGADFHQSGEAIDANLVLPNGNLVNSKSLYNAWCAYHPYDSSVPKPNVNPKANIGCKGNDTPKSPLNSQINAVLECARNAGLSIGAAYKNSALAALEGSHFDLRAQHSGPDTPKGRKGCPNLESVAEFSALLDKYCKGECGFEKKYPGSKTCSCPSDS